MGRSHTSMVLAGAAGGALIVASLNIVKLIEPPFNYIAALMMVLAGLVVIYYGRFR